MKKYANMLETVGYYIYIYVYMICVVFIEEMIEIGIE